MAVENEASQETGAEEAKGENEFEYSPLSDAAESWFLVIVAVVCVGVQGPVVEQFWVLAKSRCILVAIGCLWVDGSSQARLLGGSSI